MGRVSILTGRSGSGKSRYLRSIAAELIKKGERVLYIVPEQFTFETERALAEKRPEVEAIRQAHAHWLALEAATDPNSYPTEVFDRLVKLLPDQGIQFKEFTLDQAKLGIAGEASSFSHAKKFQTDVENSPTLKQFTWNFPQPTNTDDGRAKFQAQGILNSTGGGTHESQ